MYGVDRFREAIPFNHSGRTRFRPKQVGWVDITTLQIIKDNIMKSDIPSWLTDDRARRRKWLKELRTEIRRERRRKAWKPVGELLALALNRITSSILLVAILSVGAVGIKKFLEPVVYHYEIAHAEEIVEPEPKDKLVLATVTAYTSSVDETDDTPFITASGTRTGHGTLACPPKYEFGTQIEIEGRQFTCEDRMNRRYHDQERFDMWVETKDEAYTWGLKVVEIKILEV